MHAHPSHTLTSHIHTNTKSLSFRNYNSHTQELMQRCSGFLQPPVPHTLARDVQVSCSLQYRKHQPDMFRFLAVPVPHTLARDVQVSCSYQYRTHQLQVFRFLAVSSTAHISYRCSGFLQFPVPHTSATGVQVLQLSVPHTSARYVQVSCSLQYRTHQPEMFRFLAPPVSHTSARDEQQCFRMAGKVIITIACPCPAASTL
ncbi:hypothetical protein BsWGS_18089 [Bradybaena similaris]